MTNLRKLATMVTAHMAALGRELAAFQQEIRTAPTWFGTTRSQVEAALSRTFGTCLARSCQIESIQVHHLVPGRNEVTHKDTLLDTLEVSLLTQALENGEAVYTKGLVLQEMLQGFPAQKRTSRS